MVDENTTDPYGAPPPIACHREKSNPAIAGAPVIALLEEMAAETTTRIKEYGKITTPPA